MIRVKLFPDEETCARHLSAKPWPDGFVCADCGHDKGWELKRRGASWECVACGKETSVTAGTVMHRSHLPLKAWFTATHIRDQPLERHLCPATTGELGLGSYKSAWLLLHKLRRAMLDPDRSLLEDLVEIDETTLHSVPASLAVRETSTAGRLRSAGITPPLR